jgi:hypothetical protein
MSLFGNLQVVEALRLKRGDCPGVAKGFVDFVRLGEEVYVKSVDA